MITTRNPPASPRLHGLDALRGGALLLGIVLHSVMPFLPGGGWLVEDRYSSGVAEGTLYVIHLFRMVLFMMLAGYFGRMIVRRRGAGSYLKDRALRILLPVVVLWPIAVGSILPIVVLAGTPAPEPGSPQAPSGVPTLLLIFTPGQMWFLVVLFECVLITLAVRALAQRLLGPHRCAAIGGRLGSWLAAPFGVVLAAVPYAAALLIQETGRNMSIEPPATILPELGPLTVYLGAFLTGWLLHSRSDALTRLGRRWPWYLGIAVALTVVGDGHGVVDLAGPVQATLTALAGWTWTFGLVGMCTRLLTRESPVVRYLADASYWMYIVHLPLLLAIELPLVDLAWPIAVKLLITWAIALVLLLVSYDLLVRGTALGKWLNGRRHPRLLFPKRTPSAAPQ